MSDRQHGDAESLPRSALERIDELCDRFENAWKTNQRPQIEHFLDQVSEPERSLLLGELLVLELEYRRQSGEALVLGEYLKRFLDHSNLIQSIFADQITRGSSENTPPPVRETRARPGGNSPGQAAQPRRLGRYQITGTLGEGGFGVVYKGYDGELRREVAIKVPRRHRIVRPEDVEAYLSEARVLASLDHPHIVPVYDVGHTDDGLCFVVSKFIEGSDLKAKLGEARPPYGESAELIAVVAEALHYAHCHRLVHRDVTPGNILLDTQGQPHLADFGLALKEEDFGRGATFAGTPAYMSPEQARGEGHRVDGRSDIFSLAVVFYELLTGQRAFNGKTRSELLEQITSVEVRPLRQWDDAIPKELERICLKALCKRASERYTTAKDLADDLRYFLAESPVPVSVPPAALTPTPRRTTPLSEQRAAKIVPKGLRSFDAHDADFFLELLPGPRDREGLPDSIRFWKTRIEETEADNTFSVGLIYGPSGCGKSSLVKAGLLPRLSEHVLPVYIEATANETETRLLNGLRKRCPLLTVHLGLKAALAALRRGQGIPAGKKVLIVLDQFEQWLHARQEGNKELVEALRQCDGVRVQCIVLVRDDFWLAVSRFLKELEIRLVEGQNSGLIDLFDTGHAEKVLAAFGHAFGKLPEHRDEMSKEQKEFLHQAASGLAQEGKIICVRLALFAEMMKGKPWTPSSLKEVGGTAGVGVRFLEETFSATTAPPEHRYHQNAARGVLQALLPESGTDIKGHMRSYEELLEASGYASRPKKTCAKNFDDLLHILDSELRLITAADPEGSARQIGAEMAGEERRPEGEGREAASGLNAPSVATRFYQLTHDYLVHSLRDWLNREEQATMRGRARLLLKDLAALYSTRPENRQLPSFLQWVRIRVLTSKRKWTEPQQLMMRKAGRYHAKRGLLFTVLLLVATLGGLVAYLDTYWANRAAGLVRVLESADIAQVPGIVEELESYRYWAKARLEEANTKAAPQSREQLNTAIALLPVQSGQAKYLYDRMLDAELDFGQLPRPNVIRVILDAAAKHPPHGGDRDRILMYLEGKVGARPPPPNAKEDVKEKEAKTKAKAAVALLRMDQPEEVWPLLKHSADPRMRSYLIHVLGPAGVDFKVIRQQLKLQSDVTIRRALLLSLGEFSEDDIAADERDALVNDLCAWYIHDADSGLHGGVEWLLGQWKHGQWLKKTNDQWASQKPWREERLESIRRGLAKPGPAHLIPQWYVNSQGQTMVVIPRSVEFMMGSPLTEDGRSDDERQQQRQRIGRHFAIAAKSVTVDQFRRFLKNYKPGRGSPEPDCPVSELSWYKAAEYCNWLSDQEGLERCYEPNAEGKSDVSMKPRPDCLDRTGYRLPTEEEWECACRAGAITSRYYGESVELLRKYGWYVENSRHRSWPVATLKPNDWGLFDVHGNVWNWCHDRDEFSKTEKRTFRGGSYVDGAEDVRAARRLKTNPETPTPYRGLRPTRTLR